MKERLLKLKEFCNEHQNKYQGFYLEENVCQFMLEFQFVFNHLLQVASLKIARRKITFG